MSEQAPAPYFGEGDRNHELWQELRQHLPGPGDGKVSFTQTADHGPWLLCNGRAVTVLMGRPGLRKALLDRGSPFGVSGSDPLLPDCRERALVGAGATHALGAAFGSAPSNMPFHDHGGGNHQHGINASNDLSGAFATPAYANGGFFNVTEYSGAIISGQGAGSATDGNYPPSITLHVFIHV